MKRTSAVVALLVCMLCATPALAWNPFRKKNAYVEKGNAALQQKQYDKALQHYDKAQKAHPREPRISLNRGLALLGQARVDEAKQAFAGAATQSSDKKVRGPAYYNLGTTLLQQAQKASPEQKQEILKQSIDALKKSLRARPSDADAAWNLAYATRQLEKAQQEPPPQDQQQQQQDQNQDQDKDSKSDPNQNKDKSQDQKSAQSQPPESNAGQEPEQQKPQPSDQPATKPSDLENMLDALERQEDSLPAERLQRRPARRQKPEKDW